jgi:hypothetical protein
MSTVKPFRAFTAVDLVTVAALAALFRIMDYVSGILAFVFPFNTLVMCLSYGITAIVAAMVVRKTGVFTLFTIAAHAINFFLQGEVLIAVVLMSAWGLLGDAYVYIRVKAGQDPFSSLREMLIASLLLGIVWVVTTYWIAFPKIFLVELTFGIYAALGAFGIVAVVVGGWLGFGLGNRVKGLIG